MGHQSIRLVPTVDVNKTPTCYYVYEHWRPDINACFYVGKGMKNRARDFFSGRNKHYKHIVRMLRQKGLDVDVRIIASELSEISALDIEANRITFYGMHNLANYAAGGPSNTGWRASDELRKRLSEIGKRPENRARIIKMAAINIGNKYAAGTKRTAEHIAAIVSAHRGKKLSAAHIAILTKLKKGVPLSDEHRLKLSLAHKGKPSPNKGVAMSEEQKQKISATKRLRHAVKQEAADDAHLY